MSRVSRRDVLASLAMASASSLAGRVDDGLLAQGAKAVPPMSAAARKQAADVLLKYFGGTAPQLLRPAEGVLGHPSVAPACRARSIRRACGIGIRSGRAGDCFGMRLWRATRSCTRALVSMRREAC